MSIINKMWLCHNINKFYHIFGEAIGVTPTRTKLRDLTDTDFLLGVQFDILQVLEDYDDDQFGMSRWLKKLYEQIESVREVGHKNRLAIVLAIVIALVVGFIVGRVYTIRQAELVETTNNGYFINFGNEVHEYTYEVEVNE